MTSSIVHDPLAPPVPGATAETRNTTCYMCACRCGIRVHLRNGEIRYIEGNPDHPINKGVICAKGSSGIMKQYSPARLTKPLKRKPGTERGAGEFVEISWDEAFSTLEERLRKIRATDPKQFALFTGRDQMQALTGLFARQFGTPNYAAHGGFCSVNMAAGMIYTIGGSFWEFGGPDLERAKLFVMIGTAEDHHSNPLKIAISKFKRDGGRFISINPIRTGYSAIADDWLPIKPGTDGALLLALIHELIALGLYDREFLVRYTNAGQLVNMNEANDEFGMFIRTEVPKEEGCFDPQNKLWWDRATNRPVVTHSENTDPFLLGEFRLSDGTAVKPAFQLLKERVDDYTPEWAAGITGIPAEAIRRLAHEMGITARDAKIELPIPWTDMWGKEHDTVTGNPVAFHAMRGLAAHSNGFHTIRALAILMTLLGTIDRPGGFRHKAPFPRPDPAVREDAEHAARDQAGPPARRPRARLARRARRSLRRRRRRAGAHRQGVLVGIPAGRARDDAQRDHQRVARRPVPDRHAADLHGQHGVELDDEHVRGPQDAERQGGGRRIQDSVPRRLRRVPVRDDRVRRPRAAGHHVPRAPRRDVDARPADLGVRRAGRFGAHSGRPADRRVQAVPGSADRARRAPAASRRSSRPDGTRRFRDYPDFVVNYETEPGSGIGFLAGWRGKGGEKFMRGEPNPRQWEMYAQNNCVYHYKLPPSYQYMRNWNKGYLEWSQRMRIQRYAEPILIHLYSEVLQKFRLAAQGKGISRQPPDHLRKRIETYFDPLPFYYEPLEAQQSERAKYPLNAVTQRPMAMYHSWDSQNAWLRQIHAHNHLFVNPKVARAAGHRGRRLDVGRVAVGQGALPLQLLGGGRARHRLDVERDRQGARRVAPRARCQRVAARLPAEPPDLRGTARRGRRAHLEFGPGHRAGRVVRRPRAHLPGRGRRAEGDVRRSSRRSRRRRARRAATPRRQAFFAGRGARK